VIEPQLAPGRAVLAGAKAPGTGAGAPCCGAAVQRSPAIGASPRTGTCAAASMAFGGVLTRWDPAGGVQPRTSDRLPLCLTGPGESVLKRHTPRRLTAAAERMLSRCLIDEAPAAAGSGDGSRRSRPACGGAAWLAASSLVLIQPPTSALSPVAQPIGQPSGLAGVASSRSCPGIQPALVATLGKRRKPGAGSSIAGTASRSRGLLAVPARCGCPIGDLGGGHDRSAGGTSNARRRRATESRPGSPAAPPALASRCCRWRPGIRRCPSGWPGMRTNRLGWRSSSSRPPCLRRTGRLGGIKLPEQLESAPAGELASRSTALR